jgi:SPP1 family predicted phage head-tail adaptor
MPGAGSLDRRITLQRSTVSDTGNAYGEPVETWTTIATVWAEKIDASANESYRAQEVGAKITRRFRIRHSSDVSGLNPVDRLLYDGVVHQITGVRELQGTRNRWLEIDCVSRPDIPAAETSP